MHFLLATVSLLAVVSGVASQCTGRDSSNCATFTRNGFCTNARNTLDVRKRFCGVACGFCNRNGTEIEAGSSNFAPCVDANANCRKWARTLNFCANPNFTEDRKLELCCRTCFPIIATQTTTTRGTTTTTQAVTTPADVEEAQTEAPPTPSEDPSALDATVGASTEAPTPSTV